MRFAAFVLAAVASVTVAAQRQVYDPGNGVTVPTIVKEVKPTYTQQAKAKKIQGLVRLQAVIEDDGSVGEVVVLRSLDSELDQQAIVALKQWEFKPGTRDGKPVPVRFTCELTFTLPR
jgi:periplasmic protein TonB